MASGNILALRRNYFSILLFRSRVTTQATVQDINLLLTISHKRIMTVRISPHFPVQNLIRHLVPQYKDSTLPTPFAVQNLLSLYNEHLPPQYKTLHLQNTTSQRRPFTCRILHHRELYLYTAIVPPTFALQNLLSLYSGHRPPQYNTLQLQNTTSQRTASIYCYNATYFCCIEPTFTV